MAESHLLKLVEESRVAPPPDFESENVSIPFTFFDVFWIVQPPVERLFFYPYPHSTSHFLSSLLPSLKASLSLTLKTYYPLAGNNRRTPGTEDRFELYYAVGDSVAFTVVESNAKFIDLTKDQEREVPLFEGLVPKLPKCNELQPLFAVQVTVFPEQGIIIGTSIHHTACDGMSSMQFMHTWAATCHSGGALLSSSQIPIFDRSLIPDPSNLYSFFYNLLPNNKKSRSEGPEPFNKCTSDLVLETFTLRKSHIQKLREIISTKMEKGNISVHLSTLVVTFAYTWVGYVKVKAIDSTNKSYLIIPADYRSQISPQIPENYFGNCIRVCLSSTEVSNLIKDDGIVCAAEAIGKSFEQLKNGLKGGADKWFDDIKPTASIPILSVAGSPKFRVYSVDFGFGKPSKVEIISVAKTGAMALAESREEEGGVEIGIALSKSEMNLFKNYFSNGLKLLSD